jgi:hypothetical protein
MALMTGCTGPPNPTADRDRPIGRDAFPDLSPEQLNSVAMMDRVAGLLVDAGFVIDRRDERQGVLTTRPLPSPTLFEPWKRGSWTSASAGASTAGRLQRVVRVQVPPLEGGQNGGGSHVTEPVFVVELSRYQRPGRRVINGGRGALFSSTGMERSGTRAAEYRDYWEPLGRDAPLEGWLKENYEAVSQE